LANCVASSVTAQHIEAPLTQTISLRIAEAGFVVKINIFAPELKFQADFSPPAADLPGAGFFLKPIKMDHSRRNFHFAYFFNDLIMLFRILRRSLL
jgi:hypothetical protein